MKENKILNVILTGLNYFFLPFHKVFLFFGFIFKKIGKYIKIAFVSVKKFFRYIYGKISKLFKFIYDRVTYYIGIGIKYIKLGFKKAFEFFGKVKFIRTIIVWYQNLSKRISSRIKHGQRKAIWGVIFIVPLMIGFVYFFLLPFITTIVYSFSNVYRPNPVGETGRVVGLITEFVGLDNYKYIMNVHDTFLETLGTVFASTLTSTILILIFSLIMAVVLNSKFRGRAVVRAIFFMPVIFNSQAVEIAVAAGGALTQAIDSNTSNIFQTMFNFEDFLLNANLPVTAVNFLSESSASIFTVISYSGVQILLFLSGIQSVPKHLYEAAKIEGATQYEIFWKITFPMVSPLILTSAVYTIVDSFMSSDLLPLMAKFSSAGELEYTLGLGGLTYDGIYAAMSIFFVLIGVVTVGLFILILKPLVFYYDE